MKEHIKLLYKAIRRLGDLVGIILLIIAVLFGSGALTGQRIDRGLYKNVNMEEGAYIFGNKCAQCHGIEGEVQIGQLRLQESLLAPAGIERVIREGRGDMPSFQDELTEEEIAAVTAYVINLKE